MHYEKVTEEFIEKEFRNLNPLKSTDLDDLPARFIKDGASVLTALITHIVNLSITDDKVPDEFKVAKVIPLDPFTEKRAKLIVQITAR